MTFIQARRGRRLPNDQAEHERDQGGFRFKGRFVEAIRETLVRRDSLVEMAFVAGQRVINPLDKG